jgi:hypothetical protein
MQISHEYKFIFFSFPKTGSESVRAMLEPYSDIHGVPYWEKSDEHPFYSHISPAEVKALFVERGWNYDEYYKFTFVRNPWARLVSLYNMIYFTRPPRSLAGKLRAWLRRFSTPSFGDWLQSTRPEGEGAGGPPNQRWQVYGAYSLASYILDEDANALVDAVIRLEAIDEDLPAVLERVGIPGARELEIPFVNKRPSKNYAGYYDDASRTLVAERYGYEIGRYGYRYEDLLEAG